MRLRERRCDRAYGLAAVLWGLSNAACTTILTGSQIPDPKTAREQVDVHIETDAPLALRRHVRDGHYDVCKAPCDMTVPVDSRDGEPWREGVPSDSFEVHGEFPDAAWFRLGGRGPEVTLQVRTGSTAGEIGGAIAMGLGATAVASTSLLAGILGTLEATAGGAFDPQIVGALVGAHAAGAVALAVGIPLYVTSSTRIEISPQPTQGGAGGLGTIRF